MEAGGNASEGARSADESTLGVREACRGGGQSIVSTGVAIFRWNESDVDTRRRFGVRNAHLFQVGALRVVTQCGRSATAELFPFIYKCVLVTRVGVLAQLRRHTHADARAGQLIPQT